METIALQYFEKFGISAAAVRDRGEVYVANVQLREEDMDVASSFAGCEFAETKAIVKALKGRHKAMVKELRTLENLYIQFEQLRDFDPHNRMAQHLRKQIRIKRAEDSSIKAAIKDFVEGYPRQIDDRLEGAREIADRLAYAQERRDRIKEAARELSSDV